MSLLAGAIACLLLTACSGSDGHPTNMPRIIGYRDADHSLFTRSCLSDYFTVTESSSRVTVTLYETGHAPGLTCAVGLWSIRLHAALGARPVYDGFAGESLFIDTRASVGWSTAAPAPTRPPGH